MFRRTVSCCLCTFTGCFSQFFTVRFLDKHTFFRDSIGHTAAAVFRIEYDFIRIFLRQPFQLFFQLRVMGVHACCGLCFIVQYHGFFFVFRQLHRFISRSNSRRKRTNSPLSSRITHAS